MVSQQQSKFNLDICKWISLINIRIDRLDIQIDRYMNYKQVDIFLYFQIYFLGKSFKLMIYIYIYIN